MLEEAAVQLVEDYTRSEMVNGVTAFIVNDSNCLEDGTVFKH